MLRGAQRIKTQELYVEQVQINSEMSNKDIAECVTEYCGNKGINIKSCWVRRNRYNNESAGCKISVPIEQAERCKNGGIWPDNIVCRDWEKSSNYYRGEASHDVYRHGDSGNERRRDYRPPTESRNRTQPMNNYDDSREKQGPERSDGYHRKYIDNKTEPNRDYDWYNEENTYERW